MSNPIYTINLADKINEAILKINDNFQNVLENAGLSEAEVQALIDAAIADIVDDAGFTEQEIRDFLASQTLDLGGNKILFGNMYANVAELPDASAYHGMFAHVHNTGAAYFAHGGSWVELANKSDIGSGGFDGDYNSLTNRPSIPSGLDDLSNVDTSGKEPGQVLRWSGNEWKAATVTGGGGGGNPSGTFRETITVFTRHPKTVADGARVPPSEPDGGSYVFSSGVFSEPSGWSVSQPTSPETDELWSSTYTFVAIDPEDGQSFTAPSGAWSSPALVGGPPVDGVVGARTVQLFAYKRVAAETNLVSEDKPTGGSFDFGSNEYSAPVDEGWFAATPPRTDEAPKLYVSTGIASESGLPNDSTLDDDITWSDPQLTTSGSDGRNGRSTFTAVLYRRVADALDTNGNLVVPKPPLGGGFDFSATTPANSYVGHSATATPAYGPITNSAYSITDEDGIEWLYAKPPGEDTLWSSQRLFSLSGDEGTDWATTNGNPDGTKEAWSTPTIDVLIPVSTYFKSLYARIPDVTALDPDWNQIPDPNSSDFGNGAVYSFTTNRFTSTPALTHEGIGWYEEIPALYDAEGNSNGPLYEISTVATLRGAIGIDNTLTFTEPKLILNVAVDGGTVAQLNVYRWVENDTPPSKPESDDASFNFANKTFTIDNNSPWKKVVPINPYDETDYPNATLYVSSGVASISGIPGESKVDNNIAWSDPDPTTAGGTGAPGRSTYLLRVVTRGGDRDTPPTTPTDGIVNFGSSPISISDANGLNLAYLDGSSGSYTLAGNSVCPPAGWWDHVSDEGFPTNGNTIWEIERTFAIVGDEDPERADGGWSAPYKSKNNGEDGFSTYRIQLFKRLDKDFGSSNAEDDLRTGLGISSGLTTTGVAGDPPTGIYYSFDQDKVIGLDPDKGWSEEPADTGANALWMTQALASTQGQLTGNDYQLTWSAPIIHSRDGDPGTPDLSNLPRESRGYIYYTSPVIGSEWPDDDTYPNPLSYDGATFNWDDNALGNLPTGWVQDPIVNTNLSGDYWSARYWAEKSGGENGSTLVSFGPPFKAYNFNGVVTFQNSEGTLQRDVDGITIIDGGGIKTGRIDASLVAITTDPDSYLPGDTGLNITSSVAGQGSVSITNDLITISDSVIVDNVEVSRVRVKLGKLS
jgi:hypothetical protein